MPSPIKLEQLVFKEALDEQKALSEGEVWSYSTWQTTKIQEGVLKLRFLIHLHIGRYLFSLHVKHVDGEEYQTLVRARVTLQEPTEESATFYRDVTFNEYYLDVAAKYMIHLMFWEKLHFLEVCLNLPPLGNFKYTDCRRCPIRDLQIKYKTGSHPALFASWMALIGKKPPLQALTITSSDLSVEVLVKYVIQARLAQKLTIEAFTDIDREFLENYKGNLSLPGPSLEYRLSDEESDDDLLEDENLPEDEEIFGNDEILEDEEFFENEIFDTDESLEDDESLEEEEFLEDEEIFDNEE